MSNDANDSTDALPAAERATPETTPPVPQYAPPTHPIAPAEHRSSRLYQAAAWVGIAAGTVLIVAVIFATGFLLGSHSGHGRGGHGGFGDDRRGAMGHHGGPPMFQMSPNGRGGPEFGIPAGPGAQGAPGQVPGQSPSGR